MHGDCNVRLVLTYSGVVIARGEGEGVKMLDQVQVSACHACGVASMHVSVSPSCRSWVHGVATGP